MIVSRCGTALETCDGCYRPRRLVWTEPTGRPEEGEHVPEPGWESFPNRFPAGRGAMGVGADMTGPVLEFAQPAQDGHLCPECIPRGVNIRAGLPTASAFAAA